MKDVAEHITLEQLIPRCIQVKFDEKNHLSILTTQKVTYKRKKLKIITRLFLYFDSFMPEESEVFKIFEEENINQRFLQLEKLTFKCKEHRLLLTYNDPKNIVLMRFF